MNAVNQIATYLEIDASKIKRCEEWAKVWFVVIQGKGARFVSKKAVAKKVVAMTKQTQQGWKYVVPATVSRKAYTFRHIGTKDSAVALLDKEALALNGKWQSMSQKEIEVELAAIDEDLDRF